MTTPTHSPEQTTLYGISAAEWQQVISALNMQPETTVDGVLLKLDRLAQNRIADGKELARLRRENQRLREQRNNLWTALGRAHRALQGWKGYSAEAIGEATREARTALAEGGKE